MTWRYTPDGLAARISTEHLDHPRFRAEFVDDTDARAEVQLNGDALSCFEWIDPKPSDAEVRRLAHEADAYALEHCTDPDS